MQRISVSTVNVQVDSNLDNNLDKPIVAATVHLEENGSMFQLSLSKDKITSYKYDIIYVKVLVLYFL